MNGKIIAIISCVVVTILCFAGYMVGRGNSSDRVALETANKELSCIIESMKKEKETTAEKHNMVLPMHRIIMRIIILLNSLLFYQELNNKLKRTKP